MRRTINGKRYDTGKADAICEASAREEGCRHWEETLYRTRRGRWFIHGRGNAMTRWAVRKDDGSAGWGQKLLPITADEALAWMELHAEQDDIDEYFGEVVQDA